MRAAKIIFSLGLALLLSACGPVESLNPLYTEPDLVFDPALVGAWVGDEEGSIDLTFQRGGGRAYKLIETGTDSDTDNRMQVKYEAHLLRLGEYLFLDVVPEEPPARPQSHKLRLVRSEWENRFQPRLLKLANLVYVELAPAMPGEEDSYELRLITAHMFFKVSLDEDLLGLSYIDEDSLNKKIAQAEVMAGYDGTVLTASSRALQKFVRDHAEDTEEFWDVVEFHRRKGGYKCGCGDNSQLSSGVPGTYTETGIRRTDNPQ